MKIPAMLYRDFAVEIGRQENGEGEVRLYPLTFSSEAPVKRFSWDTWEEYWEVLSHNEGDVDFSRAANGLPLMRSHQRLLHLGSVNDIELRKKRLHGMASFSSITLGQEQETMLREGHVKTVSVGYAVTGMELAKKDKNGMVTYRCTWMPMEVSTEPIPADFRVGFGRQRAEARMRAGDIDLVEFEIEEPDEPQRSRNEPADQPELPLAGVVQTRAQESGPANPGVAEEGDGSMSGEARAQAGQGGTVPPATPPQQAPARTEGTPPAAPQPVVQTRDLANEHAEILELARRNGREADVPQWFRDGLTPDQVRLQIFRALPGQAPGQPSSESLDAMPAKDRRRYSVARAIRLQTEIMEGKRGNYDGLEAEIHTELSKRRTGADHGGVLIPWRLRSDDDMSPDRVRTLGTTQPSGGATLVPSMVMPDMIDLLRNRALVLIAGARLFPGLQGVVYWNKKTGAPTVYWMEENPPADVTGSEPAFGYVSMSPKTLIGQVQVPRQLLVMASIDVEADVRNDLAIGHGLALDLGALHGTGADKQPVGVYSAAGVQSHGVGGVPDLTDLTTMAALMADANADLGAQSWMTTPLLAGVLMRTLVASAAGSTMLWTGNFREGQLVGYPARATNQVSKTLGAGGAEHGIIFANWNDLLVGMWGNDLEIVVDVVTKAARGQILITSYSMADTAVQRPQSFVKGTGATIS